MTALSERLLRRNYSDSVHPYKIFERRVESLLGSSDVLLDAGCGRTAPVLRKFVGRANRLIGVEMVEFTDVPAGVEAINADLARLPLPDECVDIIISRSVFEHLADPEAVYREFSRVLRQGGVVVFLTANMWDYGTLIARAVPNRFHARIVNRVEGRAEDDTFPTAYRTNTRRCIWRLATGAKLRVDSFDYLSQYPNYLMFNAALFFFGMCFEKIINRVEMLRFLRGWVLVTLRKEALSRADAGVSPRIHASVR